jgi:Mg2+ and Co2+ transporter CorA
MVHDTLYALRDIFQLSAASENQFLNLVEDLMEHEIEVSRNKALNQASMLNLRYFRKVLDRHITAVTETTLLLADWEQLQWPMAAAGSAERAEADRMAVLLLRDFTHLKERAERLSRVCQEGIETLANDAAFKESEKVVANARRVERLTALATVFVPLTFTCSIFGMNFAVFGQGELHIWIFFPVATGIVALAFLSWCIVVPTRWTEAWNRLWHRRH